MPRERAGKTIYGACGRCHGSWNDVAKHITSYSPTRGLFALCDACWVELDTPAERLPFYRALFDAWERDWPNGREWVPIEAAVMAEVSS